jgi:trk system potassium uptake protein TrkH
LRYAFFNVTSIVSTTGLATSDFTKWPAGAEGLLFICYLVGGMVGSTAGGLKMVRFAVLYKYVVMKIKNLLYGRHKTRFEIDGVLYDEAQVGLIVVNIVLYYLIFLGGAVLIMLTSHHSKLIDGSNTTIDFTSAITASIANLGNIGPAVEIGNINAGPAGNYFAFSEISKIVMCILMMIGRVGVITVLTLFITNNGLSAVTQSIQEQRFDSDEPILHV